MLVITNKTIIKRIAVISIITIIAAVFLLLFFVEVQPVLAQSSADSMVWGGTQNAVGNIIGLGSEDPRIIIAKVIRVFLGFLGIIALILIMYGGWIWMTSEGNQEQISKAKTILKNAFIGLVIILLSFGVATYIINKFLQATFPGPGPGPGPPVLPPGFGAIGSCTVESVYPAPNQKNVPRNTSIMITFKEEVDPTTICGNSPCSNDPIDFQNVRLYKTVDNNGCIADPINCSGNITNVNVTNTNNFTFFFTPVNYLGSPSEFIWYTVHLTNNINKLNPSNPLKPGIFETCNPTWLNWRFEVSNKIDLTPPQVLKFGVFPPPDNSQDNYATAPAVQAQGNITVNSQPQVYTPATVVSVTPGGGSPPANVTINTNSQETGVLTVTVLIDGMTAELSKGAILFGSATFSSNSVTFPGYFTLTVPGGGYVAGNFWDVNVTPMTPADNLKVGGITYVFGTDIALGAGVNGTAANINTTLSTHPDVNSAIGVPANIVNLTAKTAGSAGNSIALSTSNTSALGIGVMSGGQDAKITATPVGKRDKAMNSVIQINFNEAINPITVSGDAQLLEGYIRVKCINGCNSGDPGTFACTGGTCVDGNFSISNQYQTVEFLSNNLCGVNGCGENIYCLPPMSNLQVEIMAASLDPCTISANCATKSPYTTCGGNNVCQNAAGINYPLSDMKSAGMPNGVMDAALNSLDGNRNSYADGPQAQSGQPAYDENNPVATDGDDYMWSFWISDIIDLIPPTITSITPVHTGSSVSLSNPVEILFDELMMSGSLRTGTASIYNGLVYIKHQLINIWNFAGKPTGYWISKNDIDTSSPPDGQPDITKVFINHSMFYDSTSYRSQVGSGVKDIYQNCYKPSAGAGCAADPINPSCCGLTPTPASSCP